MKNLFNLNGWLHLCLFAGVVFGLSVGAQSDHNKTRTPDNVSTVSSALNIPVLEQSTVASQIKQTFERNLFQLPPRIQGHFGIRMYRISGDDKYLASALYDYYVVSDRLHAIHKQLNSPNYIAEKSKQLAEELSKGKRGQRRKAAIKSYPEFIFYADELLRYASRLDAFGGKIPAEFITTLKQYDFLPALTDKAMIRAWAAQLANYVYWLKQLGIADYTKQYKIAFMQAYPDTEDRNLSKWHFRNKLYGLTHFVFAASRYYQQHVSEQEFGWILRYFEQHQARIFKQATDDIIAEVGLSFLLMKKMNHPLVEKSKQRLIQSFDQQAGMIPSVSGSTELATGEHRNVLAYMLLSWPETLHQGPYFAQIDAIKKELPRQSFEQSNQTREGN
ncbi:DUF3541 domain-containing protein [Thalassotalea aquiviva]|uniref:DUF3541 domain-containing protein n=1 Tax=Thalassotalea aquiviva TaxID=3242415 RepID=UPI00352B05A4